MDLGSRHWSMDCTRCRRWIGLQICLWTAVTRLTVVDEARGSFSRLCVIRCPWWAVHRRVVNTPTGLNFRYSCHNYNVKLTNLGVFFVPATPPTALQISKNWRGGGDKNRLEAFLRRAGKSGYYTIVYQMWVPSVNRLTNYELPYSRQFTV